MKNKNLMKVIFGFIMFVFVLTWLIPASQIETDVIKITALNPQGLVDIFSSFDILTAYFLTNSLLLLAIAIFYAVLNKTGAYKTLVDKLTKLYEENPNLGLISIICFLTLLTSILEVYFPLLFIVFLIISVLVNAKVDKKTIILSTFGSMLIGFSSGIFSNYFPLVKDNKWYIFLKIGFLLISFLITALYAVRNKKTEKYNKEVSEYFFTAEGKNKNIVPLIVIFSVLFVLLFLGIFNFNTNFFINVRTTLFNFKIFGFPLLKNIFGDLAPFGQWGNKEFFLLVSIVIVVIKFVYKLKFEDIFIAIKEAVQKYWVFAVIIMLLNLTLVFVINSGIYGTIINLFAKTGNVLAIAVVNLLNIPLWPDPLFFSAYVPKAIDLASIAVLNQPFVGLIGQLFYGIGMLIAPTSVLIVVGLMYLEESYKNWLKYIWKYVLMIFGLSIIILVIAYFI